MKPDETIAMAREAGFRTGYITTSSGEQTPFIAPVSATHCLPEVLRFAALVAAKEREACAQLAGDSYYGNPGELNHEIAAAIRARGQA